MGTIPGTPQQGRIKVIYTPDRTIADQPKKGFSVLDRLARVFGGQADHLAASVIPKERGPLVQSAAVQRLLESLGSLGAKESFLEACADLAQMGLSAGDLEQIAHAMTHRRILAFSAGTIADLGEAGHYLDGSTRGSKTYEGTAR